MLWTVLLGVFKLRVQAWLETGIECTVVRGGEGSTKGGSTHITFIHPHCEKKGRQGLVQLFPAAASRHRGGLRAPRPGLLLPTFLDRVIASDFCESNDIGGRSLLLIWARSSFVPAQRRRRAKACAFQCKRKLLETEVMQPPNPPPPTRPAGAPQSKRQPRTGATHRHSRAGEVQHGRLTGNLACSSWSRSPPSPLPIVTTPAHTTPHHTTPHHTIQHHLHSPSLHSLSTCRTEYSQPAYSPRSRSSSSAMKGEDVSSS